MRKRLLRMWAGIGRGRMPADDIDQTYIDTPVRRSPIRLLVLCGVVLIAAIAIGTAVMAVNFRERALSNSERELENTVLLLARHFDRELENFEVVQKDLVTQMQLAGVASPEAFRRQMSTPDMHLMLKTKVSGTSDVAGVNVFDSDGELVNSSRSWPVPALNVADRAYFKAFKSDLESPTVLLAPVHSRLSGGWTTVVARKVTGPNGELLGLVTRGIAPANFENFFESLSLGEGAAISLFHRDGTLLARYPHVEAMIGRNFITGPVHQQILSNSDHGAMRLVSPIDDQERLASVRQLSQFPISVIATTTVAAALADWSEQTRVLIIAAGLSAVVIAVTLFLIVRQLSRQHQASRRRLAVGKQRLDTAVNNMTQGLLLFDSSQRLVVYNRRYIEIYGLSPDVIKPGCTFREIITHRQETGSFVGNIDEYCFNVVHNIALEKDVTVETSDGRSIRIATRQVADGGWVATHEDVTEHRRSEEKIEHLAHYDTLTDLPNRALLREQIEQQLKRINRGEQFALLYIDIDQFKSINDSLGHPVGDELLKAVATRLRGCIRETDFVARLSGDEFAIVQTAVIDPTDVTDLVTRIYETIRQPYQCLGHQLTTDASIGIALAPQDGTDLDQLIKNADLAMYGAKADGRRTYRFFEPAMDASAKARRTLEQDLRQAIVGGNIEIYYQPVVNLRSNEVTGCEALLRWRHPERGMISPAEFIPVAEDTGLIAALGEWVLKTACAEAATWPDHVRLAVNVSPVQFKCQTLALKVAAALTASGLPASRLELEITEAVLIRDDEEALTILHQLRAIGVRIALDDFGTGYSSLSYLQRFPFDKIKIDRCFINNIAEIDGSSPIVQAVVNIATARNMTTTAEGVETPEQREMLRALGCTEMQGYLFSAAKAGPEVRRLLGTRRESVAAVA